MMNMSSDALSMNVFDVLLDICSKFTNRNSQLLQKINPLYLKSGKKFDIDEAPLVTKLAYATDFAPDTFADTKEFGTVTEYFFLTLEIAHVCYIPILHNFVESREVSQRIEDELKNMDPNHYMRKQLEKEAAFQKNQYLAYHVILEDEKRIMKIIDLYDTFIYLLLQWCGIQPEKLADAKLVNYVPREILKIIPEHYITDLFEFHSTTLKFKDKYGKFLCDKSNGTINYVQNLVEFLTVVLSEIDVISNPYTKAKILQLVAFIGHDNPQIENVYANNDVAIKNLTRALVKFYIDIEFTGQSQQFYAKFEYRHYCQMIFKSMWKVQAYRENLIKLASDQLFERFINMIMNDLTYCMDEGVAKINELLELYAKSNKTPEERKTEERNEGICRSVFSEALQSLELMAKISEPAPHAFFWAEFRKRLAGMLNYFVAQIIDPKLTQIKDPSKINFKPVKLLKEIIKIYVNLSHDEEFCLCVSKDERSYDADNLLKALKKGSREADITPDVKEKFEMLIKKTSEKKVEMVENDIDVSEAPDEFICPISGDIMQDPVMLPSSKQILDKGSIKQILLNGEIDPFNRSPLKFSEVIELPDLKNKIDTWIVKKKEEMKKKNTKSHKQEMVEEKADMEEEKDDEVGRASSFNPYKWNDMQ